ncbi:hypothetical protein [Paraburkholderia solisilvae]|uniref:t-SNARE coiled-coil homology domain-containing protein n=1 Tax=Paraburkholderia solisilvae TaxID=624376 RepID=A0A6J5DEZ8_9BURK|nr:hypothetical protein [Paraburkholderia solisilvae]CAB3751742.1 hypothetical protein LMG29739_01371 [Paraburkholderia solisilvae]
MQTINVSGNQQVQFYNYEHGEDNQPGNPQAPIHSRSPAGDPNVQSEDGRNDSRIFKDRWLTPLQSRFEALSNQVAGVAGNINSLSGQIGGLSKSVDNVQNGVTNVQDKFGDLDRSIGQVNKNIESLNVQTSQNQTSLGNIETTLGKLGPKIESTASEVTGLKDFEQWVKQNGGNSGH